MTRPSNMIIEFPLSELIVYCWKIFWLYVTDPSQSQTCWEPPVLLWWWLITPDLPWPAPVRTPASSASMSTGGHAPSSRDSLKWMSNYWTRYCLLLFVQFWIGLSNFNFYEGSESYEGPGKFVIPWFGSPGYYRSGKLHLRRTTSDY